jgi:hypothetical protein
MGKKEAKKKVKTMHEKANWLRGFCVETVQYFMAMYTQL